MDEEAHIKIYDFGLAIAGVFLTDWAMTCCGTVPNMAPEVTKYYCLSS
jgi:serine/threonine protein kinase